ncbi:MAG TPA: 4-coumarate--CoA ligase family protein [Gemmatimonadaceae bacterium]|nr:4-coumarate--CoA ligase family protein [Gemmatimonadaceae bacterium]
MIFRSRFPDAEIPDKTLQAYVFEHADNWPDLPALIDGPSGRALTYRQVRKLSESVAVGLTARGFRKGDALCIYSPNLPEYAAVFFGVAMLGGLNTTANPMYTADELARQLRDSRAKFVVTIPMLAERAREAATPVGAEVIVFGDAPGCMAFTSLVATGGAPPAVDIDPQDVVALPYSSGTTGLPKGVMLTHRNLVANLAQCAFIDSSVAGDHMIGVLPFFHIYGMAVVLCMMLRRGASVVTIPQFDLELYLRLSQQYRVKAAYLVPPIALALAKHPLVDKYDLSSLEMITSGAAPMGPELERACASRLGCFVKQGYGMTEASPVTHFTPNDPALIRSGSCGLLIPNTECRVVDLQTGKDLGAGQHGELLIRGPQIMAGYLNQPAATAEVLDSDGWLHSGDVGYADADGYFFIVDRLKEFIKYKGYQVAPAELEAVLLTHPAVADVAVIPAADAEAGEIPKAFVVARRDVGVEELIAFVAAVVAPFKKVRAIEFIERIPKSPSGKILRRELIARDRAKKHAVTGAPAAE